jgi:hypothetical protein
MLHLWTVFTSRGTSEFDFGPQFEEGKEKEDTNGVTPHLGA